MTKEIKISLVVFFALVIGLGVYAGSKVDYKMCDNTAIICK